MARLKDLQNALQNPNVQKMLNLIAASEGVKHGYNTMFGNQRIENLGAHPNVRKRFEQTDGKVNYTTAAGRYQFLYGTWSNLANAYGFKDFSPRNQDLGAVALIAGRGALQDVLKGNYRSAILKLGPEWASLPSSTYKQGKRSWDFVNKQLGQDVGGGTSANSASTLFYGDSIANGFRQYNRGAGSTQNGASPQWVLQQLQQSLKSNPNAFKGQNIVLSSGYSNNVNDLKNIEQQLFLLKKAGANVQLLGVSNQYNLHGQNGGAMNGNLQRIAQKYGANFLGGFEAGKDNIHPNSYQRNFGQSSGRASTYQPQMVDLKTVGIVNPAYKPQMVDLKSVGINQLQPQIKPQSAVQIQAQPTAQVSQQQVVLPQRQQTQTQYQPQFIDLKMVGIG